MSVVNELICFLAKGASTGPKNQALTYITGLPDSEDGRSLLLKNPDMVKAVALLVLQDENSETISRAYKCLTNFTSVPAISEHLVEHDYGGLMAHLVDRVLESDDSVALQCAAMLSNLTRGRQGAEKLWTLLHSTNKSDALLAALCSSASENRDHLSFVFSNLSQLDEVRSCFRTLLLSSTWKRWETKGTLLVQVVTGPGSQEALCHQKCREHIKNSGAYYVLRELHKSESCRPVVVACENLVDILISDEPEPGMENLKDVDIPEHLTKKFEAYNEELLKE
ncbi:hypothetical protein HPB52_015059 [Rhipicephalus sanguineus]|uniref:Protein HGH1 C-terminal domain-containing protein n=1 Tax=Rhipicephalus sanguineus TaxID=34632 RepID=A0A9D4PWQ7_RHISA|nr:hypothetical protein HPB52_015059 [Rhipicephalus sanguineus]